MRHNVVSTSRSLIAAAIALAAGLLITSCSSTTSSVGSASPGKVVTSDASTTLLVWTDSTREPGFQEFQQTHPDVKMKIETYDPTTLLTKLQLFNRTGAGWPDVVFVSNPDQIANLASTELNFAQPLDTLIPAAVQQGFGATDDSCKIDGKLYCLRNDIGQTVLWYNKKLLTQFGYSVPTTWAQYEALGAEVAKQHPGYVVGDAGDQYSYYDYFAGSGCPVQDVTGPNTVHIDLTDATCTRVASMLDTMLANGSVSKDSLFSPDLNKLGQAQKVLMLPGASWFGDFLFKPASSFNTPNGEIAAAAYPAWPGETTDYSGGFGGGVYVVSQHSKNMKGAAEIVQWMGTDTAYQKSAPTYPAYAPAAQAWSQRLSTDPFYATDPFPVLQQQASKINPEQHPTSFDVQAAFTAVLTPAVQSGKNITSVLPQLQSELVNLAKAAGYVVK